MARPSGRGSAIDEARNLLVLWGVASTNDADMNADIVSRRLGISRKAAAKLLGLLASARGNDSDYLSLYSKTEDPTQDLSTISRGGTLGRAVKLTKGESLAVTAALNQIGIAEDDPLRRKLSSLYYSHELDASEFKRTIAAATTSPNRDVIKVCSEAIADARQLTFDYRGTNDLVPRVRTVLPQRIWTDHKNWFLDALDVDVQRVRTFRTDRMGNIELRSVAESKTIAQNTQDISNTYEVTLYFYDSVYLTLFDWPGLTVASRVQGCIVAKIPYYRGSSTWLATQIAACGGSVFTDDASLNTQVDDYIRTLLESGETAQTCAGE